VIPKRTAKNSIPPLASKFLIYFPLFDPEAFHLEIIHLFLEIIYEDHLLVKKIP